MGNFAGKDDSGEMEDSQHGGRGRGYDPTRAHGNPRSPMGGQPAVMGQGFHGGQPHHPQGVGPPHGPGHGVGHRIMGSEGAHAHAHHLHHSEMVIDDDDAEEDAVPTVFKWEHGGRQVYIQGTFNNWERQIPMHRSGNDFTYICDLKRGKHAFKFIVDDEWRFAPDQLTVADVEGRINNYIDVTHFHPFSEENSCLDIAKKDEEVYGQIFPDVEDYSLKEPPNLPPHLRHIILNKVPADVTDPSSLPVPLHVALDHLYCTAIKDGMMVLGCTQRYQHKFVSTVYYACMP